MTLESTQHRLSRDRAPRVQITYDLERGDAHETRELPFVLGILGDFAGQRGPELPRLKERGFTSLDRDSFDQVLEALAPRVSVHVPNRLQSDGPELRVDLTFRSMEDFEPGALAAQVPPLRRLLEARSRLSDLRNKAAGNGRLDDVLDVTLRTPAPLGLADPGEVRP